MHERGPQLVLMIAALFVLSGSPASKAGQPGGSDASGDPIAISGRVGDLQGSAVEGAQVTLIQMIHAEGAFVPDPKVMDEKTTAIDGTFTLVIPQGVDPMKGSYVVARKEGLALGWAPWRLRDNRRIDLLLGEGKDLAGQVVGEQGEPVVGVEVRVSSAMMGKRLGWRSPGAPEFLRAQTDDDGRFLFADMPVDGTFEFFAEKPGRAQINTLHKMASVQNGYQFSPDQAGIKVVLPLEAVVEGVVVAKSDGKPVAGATVVALATSGQGMLLSPRPVTSARDGAFRIGGLAAGAYSVQIAVPTEQKWDWASEPVRVLLQAGQTESGVKLQFVRYGAIEVSVREPSDGPIAHAAVSVFTVLRDQRFDGFTDANGLTCIRVPPGEYQVTGVRKEGHGRPTIENEVITVVEGKTVRVECVLRRSRATGTVRDPAGDPLSGVKLTVPSWRWSEATSDASGRFEITWDPMPSPSDDASSVLVARDATCNLAQVVHLSGLADEFDIRLEPAVTLAGTVLNHEGKPLEGARVIVELHAQPRIVLVSNDIVRTGPDGVFEARTIPANNQYRVSAVAGGYGRITIPVDVAEPEGGRCEVAPFKLPVADQSLSGVVVDPTGRPVAEAEVSAFGQGQPYLPQIATDAHGKFAIQGVCKGLLRLHVSTNKSPILYGDAEVEAGATGAKVIISEKGENSQYILRRPASLGGRPLPPLGDLGIDLPADEGKMLLLCFWDMGQRPSRNCVMQLAARATQLGEKEVTVVVVQAAKSEGDALNRWIEENKVPFRVGQIGGDIDKTRFAWGAVSLPHLILTNREHVVIAEGFSLADLDSQIEAPAGR